MFVSHSMHDIYCRQMLIPNAYYIDNLIFSCGEKCMPILLCQCSLSPKYRFPYFTGICKLKNLQELNLWGNHLQGGIHPCFGQMNSLETLDLSCNQISGSFPSFIISNTWLHLRDFISQITALMEFSHSQCLLTFPSSKQLIFRTMS